MTEHQLHRAVAEYLALALPEQCWWTTFPAGGGGRIRGAQLKSMGLRAGVPDILILRDWMNSNRPRTFWIELKTATGRASIEQKICHAELKAVGCNVAVCRSVNDVQETLIGWGFVPRARAA